MTELKITETPIPEVTRQREPNPFEGQFPADDKALQVTLPGKENDNTDNGKAIRRVQKQAREAAHAVDRSARFQKEYDGKRKHTTLTIWTVERIKRPRNESDSDK